MAEITRPILAAVAALPERPRKSRFAVDLVSFASANILYLLVTAVTTFLIPRVLSVEAFGAYRLFLLYGSYVGVLHLGYLDGALVAWASAGTSKVQRELPAAVIFVGASLFGFSLLAAAAWVTFTDAGLRWLIPPLAAFAVIANLTTVCLYALQAEKRFRQLSTLTLLQPALLLTFVCLLSAQHATETRALLFAYLSSSTVALALAWRFAWSQVDWHWPSTVKLARSSGMYLRSGIMILLANLGTNLILGADRIITSSHFSIQQFAIYSFAATFFYSAFFVVLSVAKVFFPYLSTEIAGIHIHKVYSLAERLIIALWVLGLAAYFPIAWATKALLPSYTGSIPLIRILLLGTGVTALTQLLHSNFFRVMRRPSSLLIVGAFATSLAFVSLEFSRRFDNLGVIAWTTVFVVVCWWLSGDLVLSYSVGRLRSRTVLSFCVMSCAGSVFLLCSRNATAVNALLYVLCAGGIATLLLRRSFRAIRELRIANTPASADEVTLA